MMASRIGKVLVVRVAIPSLLPIHLIIFFVLHLHMTPVLVEAVHFILKHLYPIYTSLEEDKSNLNRAYGCGKLFFLIPTLLPCIKLL